MKKGNLNFKKNIKLLNILCLLSTFVLVCFLQFVYAYFSSTDEKTNVLGVGKLEIELIDINEEFKMIPGTVIQKDPKVIVKSGTSDSWVFIQMEKSDNFDDCFEYEIADDWQVLDGVSGSDVYWRETLTTNDDLEFYILKDNQLMVKETVTKEMMTTLDETKISFKGYAVQKTGVETVSDAWDLVGEKD